MSTILTIAASSYISVALTTFMFVEGSLRNKVVSALLWPTFPFWPG